MCNLPKYCKHGKNPAETTIDGWVKRAKREGKPVKIVQRPDSHENHYPEQWIMDQIDRWNPRTPVK